MTKSQTFKLRLDAEDRERLELVAEHFNVPSVTAIRILIKNKVADLQARLSFDMVKASEEILTNPNQPERVRAVAVRFLGLVTKDSGADPIAMRRAAVLLQRFKGGKGGPSK
jgi:antitoxin component of RelBE/YafQ-DinJ toxin-antitoxin module